MRSKQELLHRLRSSWSERKTKKRVSMAQLESSGGREKGNESSLYFFISMRIFVANYLESDITLVKNTKKLQEINSCVFVIIYLCTQR